MGDGPFAVYAKEHMKELWWKLTRGMGVPRSAAEELWTEVGFDPTSRHRTKRATFNLSIFDSPLSNLSCRGELHLSPSLRSFNTPLYLATDSRLPTTDPLLAPFFAAFPCTFILSDFDRPSSLNNGSSVDSVGRMLNLVNKADGVPLGRLLLPFLEAMVVAKGSMTFGTPGSTFSGMSHN